MSLTVWACNRATEEVLQLGKKADAWWQRLTSNTRPSTLWGITDTEKGTIDYTSDEYMRVGLARDRTLVLRRTMTP